MLFTIDIGNTNITYGLYKGDQLNGRWRISTDHTRMPDEYGLQLIQMLNREGIDQSDIEGIIMASVVPPVTTYLSEAFMKFFNKKPMIVNHETKTGVPVKIDDPATVGADRIVNAVAVKKYFGGPACIIDFGTATTFDAVDDDMNYIGGAITPGVHVAEEALFQRTSKLPRVEIKRPPNVIGQNTIHAIQSGLLFGYVSLVEGMVKRFSEELGPEMKVIATGGLASFISKETDAIHHTCPWLTLDGLRIIWEINQ